MVERRISILSSPLHLLERRTSILSSPLENLGLKFSSPQFAYKNSGFWDQIFRGELKPQRCTLAQNAPHSTTLAQTAPSCTRAELEAVSLDLDSLRLQSLIICERILGTQHKDMIYRLMYRGAAYADSLQYHHCIGNDSLTV